MKIIGVSDAFALIAGAQQLRGLGAQSEVVRQLQREAETIGSMERVMRQYAENNSRQIEAAVKPLAALYGADAFALIAGAQQLRGLDAQSEVIRQLQREAETAGSMVRVIQQFAENYSRQIVAAVKPLAAFYGTEGSGLAAFRRMLEGADDQRRMLERVMGATWREMSHSIADVMETARKLRLEEIGSAIRLSDAARQSITAHFMATSDSFWGYNAYLGSLPGKSSDLPASIRRLPLNEYVEQVRFVDAITVEEPTTVPPTGTKNKSHPTPSARQGKKTTDVLRMINSDLVVFWDETEKIATSESRAKGKSACANLRTIVCQVLDALAPQQEARKTCGDHDDIKAVGGKGAFRKTQVRYIGGGVDTPHSLAVEDQVAFLLGCLNDGDHGVATALKIGANDIHRLMGITGTCVTTLYAIHVSTKKRRSCEKTVSSS